MSITIHFDSFEKIKNYLLSLSRGLKNATRDTAKTLIVCAGRIAKERVRSTSKKPNMGRGIYFRSIKSKFRDDGGSFIGKLESNSPIAGIIEFGSRPHIIRPKGNKLLFWSGARHPVKEVKHPGTPAFKVLGNATEEAVEERAKVFESAIRRKIDSL